eukprot:SAG31_NODE_3835_length_3836_cov_1.537062_3_plen_180_part_00
MSDVPDVEKTMREFMHGGFDLGGKAWKLALAAKGQIDAVIEEVQSIEKSLLNGMPAMNGEMMLAVREVSDSLGTLAELKLAGARRTRKSLQIWQNHVEKLPAEQIVQRLQAYIDQYCTTDDLEQINNKLGEVLSNVTQAFTTATETKAKTCENVKQVRGYFLVCVPTIREIRDFYRVEM